jgi:hypothetical protein
MKANVLARQQPTLHNGKWKKRKINLGRGGGHKTLEIQMK